MTSFRQIFTNIQFFCRKATKNGVRVVTPEKEVVKLHPSSINAKVKTIPSPYLVYYLKRKSTDIFLLETSGVNPVALLLASPSSAVGEKLKIL